MYNSTTNTQRFLILELETILNEDIQVIKEREKSTFDRLSSPFNDSIVLFGAGGLAKQTIKGLKNLGIIPLALSDNNPNLWNTFINGIEVLSPNDAVDKYKDKAVFVVTVWNPKTRFTQIKQQLLDLKCPKVISIFSLFWKYPETFLPHYSWDLPHKIVEQKEDIIKAFSLWSDEKSRLQYLAQIKLKMFLDFEGLSEPTQESYFLDDVFTFLSDEVFIDCGAYDGDTLKSFIKFRQNNFKKYLALEPDPNNLEHLKKAIFTNSNDMQNKIDIYPVAAGIKHEKLRFDAVGNSSASIGENGNIEIESIPLDELLINCPPTFIKMDIEGFEADALIGASNIIKQTMPILAICVYHKQHDLWSIPLLIQSLCSNYRFFLRTHEEDGLQAVCYAVPAHRCMV